ncbi:MAG: hypothetical protein ACLUJG_08550 [Lawsonibacter sp.]
MTDRELVARAFSMHRFSYVPYSHFPVGAALLRAGTAPCLPAATWRMPPSAPPVICAERTASLKAVSEGHRDDRTAIAVAGRGEDSLLVSRQLLTDAV